MTRTHPKHRSHIVAALLVLALTPVPSGCGDSQDPAKAKKAAEVLTDFYYQAWKPPSADWAVRRVRVEQDNTVTIEASIATKTLSKAIMERSRMEQMEIARMACPDLAQGVWKQIDKKQNVNVSLTGEAGHIINALCDTGQGVRGK